MTTGPLLFHLLMFPSFYDFFLEFSLFSFALSWLNLYWVRRRALMFILQFSDARPSWKGGACFQWRDTSKVVRSTKSHLESDGHWTIWFVNQLLFHSCGFCALKFDLKEVDATKQNEITCENLVKITVNIKNHGQSLLKKMIPCRDTVVWVQGDNME